MSSKSSAGRSKVDICLLSGFHFTFDPLHVSTFVWPFILKPYLSQKKLADWSFPAAPDRSTDFLTLARSPNFVFLSILSLEWEPS